MRHFFPVLGFFIAATISAQAEDLTLPPRLWEIRAHSSEGTETIFNVLAASHLGLPIEYDDYFQAVALPRFEKADVLWFEGVGDGEPEDVPTCNVNDLDQNGKQVLAKMRQIVAARYYESQKLLFAANNVNDPRTDQAKKRVSVSHVNKLDEYELIQANNLALSTIAQFEHRNETDLASKTSLRGSVIAYLLSKKPNIEFHDIDSRFGVKRAYCTAGPKRISFLQDQIQGTIADGQLTREKIAVLEHELVSLISTRGSTQPDSLGIPGLESTFTCNRNKEWVSTLLQHMDGKTHFVTVGAAHIFDIDRAELKCPGLLSLLSTAGLTPVLIQ